MARGGLGVVWHWLMLAFRPYDERRQLQCMRVTAHWVGFTSEVLMRVVDMASDRILLTRLSPFQIGGDLLFGDRVHLQPGNRPLSRPAADGFTG